MSGSRYSTLTTLYDRNYDFVNIQKWIIRISADELVPRFISFNDFQWISTENLYEKDKFSNILNFFSQRIIETGCQVSMSHVTSRDTTHVTPPYKTKIKLNNNLFNPFKYDLRCASLCGVDIVFPYNIFPHKFWKGHIDYNVGVAKGGANEFTFTTAMISC